MLKFIKLLTVAFAAGLFSMQPSSACTGISLTAKDGSKVIARTMEWGGFYLESHLILVPRGHKMHCVTPSGNDGMVVKAKYGYAGVGVLKDNFLAEGINEMGLVGELFYFPNYGESETYDPAKKNRAVSDVQFLDWALASFGTIDELVAALPKIHYVAYGRGFDTAHYSLADASGRQVVIEFYDNEFHVHENTVGVITNAPTFDWHLTNLNTYVNVFAGTDKPRKLNDKVTLTAFGVGSAAYGLPGDLTPTSRFVRAAFYVSTARQQDTGHHTVLQTLQILNNFDLPLGTEFKVEEKEDLSMLSGTQWTTSTDIKAKKMYYRTEWNSTIRCIDLNKINFAKAAYQVLPMDKVEEQPIEYVHFK